MKKLLLKLTVALFFLFGYSKNSSAQLISCNPWECNPDPCYVIHFVNNTGCEFDWISTYAGCSGSNPGFHVTNSASPQTWTLACMKCGDMGSCECPLWVKLVDPGVGTIEDWGDLTSWNWSSTEFDNIPFGDCECGGSYELKITITLGPNPNEATVTIDCS